MTNKICIIVASLLLNCSFLCGQKLPSTAMGKPVVFVNEQTSWKWEEIALKRDWGELSDKPWKVYIDKEDAKAFAKPDAASSVNQTCHFLDSYYVAEINDGFALLFTQPVPALKISSKAKALGWVSVDDLILWTTCPRTQNQVYRKAIIVSSNNSYENYPKFSKSPTSTLSNGLNAEQLQIYFVFKESAHSALIFPGRTIDDDVLSHSCGWLQHSQYINWNTRLCLEPNFGTDVAGLYAAVFDNKQSAMEFKVSYIDYLNALWKCQLQNTRSNPSELHFPILDVDRQNIYHVIGLSPCDAAKVDTFSNDVEKYLVSIGVTPQDIQSLKSSRVSVKFNGYTSRISQDRVLFDISVFMTETELRMLIKNLAGLKPNSSENQRLELQNALKKLAMIYIGQSDDDMTLDDLMAAVSGCGRAMAGRLPFGNVNINAILDPNKVPQKNINELIRAIDEGVKRLCRIEFDKSCYFTFNNERYYYILLDDMPLQGY